MRLTSLFAFALILNSPAMAADVGQHSLSGPQIDVRLSVADPCLNSRNADLSLCESRLTQRTSEAQQWIHAHTRNGEMVNLSPSQSYIVRTTDYY